MTIPDRRVFAAAATTPKALPIGLAAGGWSRRCRRRLSRFHATRLRNGMRFWLGEVVKPILHMGDTLRVTANLLQSLD